MTVLVKQYTANEESEDSGSLKLKILALSESGKPKDMGEINLIDYDGREA